MVGSWKHKTLWGLGGAAEANKKERKNSCFSRAFDGVIWVRQSARISTASPVHLVAPSRFVF